MAPPQCNRRCNCQLTPLHPIAPLYHRPALPPRQPVSPRPSPVGTIGSCALLLCHRNIDSRCSPRPCPRSVCATRKRCSPPATLLRIDLTADLPRTPPHCSPMDWQRPSRSLPLVPFSQPSLSPSLMHFILAELEPATACLQSILEIAGILTYSPEYSLQQTAWDESAGLCQCADTRQADSTKVLTNP